MQQKEITANTRATSMQERTTRRLELHSRRDSYFKLLMLVDTEGMLTSALLDGSASGLRYRILRQVSGEESMDPIFGISPTVDGRSVPARN